MNISLFAQILRLLGYAPLLAYPAVLVANAMQAAALLDPSQRKPGSASRRALVSSFVGGTTLYPVVVLASRALATNAANETRELAWSALPLAFTGVLAGLFALWSKGDAVE